MNPMVLLRAISPTRIALILALVIASMIDARAQLSTIPHTSDWGVEHAEEFANESLPDDAVLVVIGAVGNAEANGVPLGIDPSNGEASAWGYIYYSASINSWTSVAVIDFPAFGVQTFETEPPVDIPASVTNRLDLSLPYAMSGTISPRLAGNTIYTQYRTDNPSTFPTLLAFRPLVEQDIRQLPASFPKDAPVWSIDFYGENRDTLICWVAGQTGETHCARSTGVASVVDDENGARTSRLTATPNPASDELRVTLVSRAHTSDDVRFELYDMAGRKVLDPTSVERTDDGWSATFDARAIASGAYVCRAVGADWVESVSVVK